MSITRAQFIYSRRVCCLKGERVSFLSFFFLAEDNNYTKTFIIILLVDNKPSPSPQVGCNMQKRTGYTHVMIIYRLPFTVHILTL